MFSSNTSQVSSAANYIEDVFSTFLYTGNGSTQTITNGIDLSGKGGLVWIKDRTTAGDHYLFDTNRGVDKALQTDTTAAELSVGGNGVNPFNSNGFTVNGGIRINVTSDNFASWTFRKQPKFFDVVTFTENTAGTQTISHSLGSTPGCIILKVTSRATDWYVYHTSLGTSKTLNLNSTSAQQTLTSIASVSSTDFGVAMNNIGWGIGTTWVAYVFAHNAGGFGLTGTDNVISCGSYTGAATAPFVSLGYEPQWVLVKRTSSVADWRVYDAMRGMTVSTNTTLGPSQQLKPNTSDAETSTNYGIRPDATGFTDTNAVDVGGTYIYIAIRRGPMKTPTSGTSVFAANTTTSTTAVNWTTGFDVDFTLTKGKLGTTAENAIIDRLRGNDKVFYTNSASAESTNASIANLTYSKGYQQLYLPTAGETAVSYGLSRSPQVLDQVCWSGTGAASLALTHNLTVAPEMIWFKNRTNTGSWFNNFLVYTQTTGTGNYLQLDLTSNAYAAGTWFMNSTAPTASSFTIGSGFNESGQTYTAYLFGTCVGVSKVGSYSGTGSTQTINCGFTGGARFVMIKRTDTYGYGWFVWDTARGMVAGTDPSILLNSNAAQVNANSVYTTSGGFQIVSTAADINASGGTYIYWALA